MTRRKNKELELVDQFVTELMGTEQDEFSKLVLDLKAAIGGTKEFEDTQKILIRVYKAKLDILEKIHNRIQSI